MHHRAVRRINHLRKKITTASRRFALYCLLTITVVPLLVLLSTIFLTSTTYNAKVTLHLSPLRQSSDASLESNLSRVSAFSTAKQIILSRGLAEELIKRNNLSELPEFDPNLRIDTYAARFLREAESYLKFGTYSAAPEQRVLESYYGKLKVVSNDPDSQTISIEFDSQDPSVARALTQSIAEDLIARKDTGQSINVVVPVVEKQNSRIQYYLYNMAWGFMLAVALLLLISVGAINFILSLVARFRFHLLIFSATVVVLFALGARLGFPEYRSDAEIFLSETPLYYEGRPISPAHALQQLNDLVGSDEFVARLIRSLKLGNLERLNQKTRNHFLQNLSIRLIDGTRIIQIAYQSADEDLSQKVVSSITDQYLKWRQAARKKINDPEPGNPDEVLSPAREFCAQVSLRWLSLFTVALALNVIGALLISLASFIAAKAKAIIENRVVPTSFGVTSFEKVSVLFLVVIPLTVVTFAHHFLTLSDGLAEILGYSVLFTWFLGYLILRVHQLRRRKHQINLNNSSEALLESGAEYCLYLRSFITSERLLVRNRLPGLLERMLLGSYWDLEFALAYALRKFSPIVAIGLAGDGVGASKVTVDDDDWKEVFANMASKASLIFIVPFATAGTHHEMMALADDAQLLRKTVWIMPPSYFGFRWSVLFAFRKKPWERVRKLLAANHLELPRYSRHGGLFIFNKLGSPAKQIATDDFSEDRMFPFSRALVAATKCGDESEYSKQLNDIRFPKRNLRWFLSEWLFRRWLCDRLAGFSITAIIAAAIALFLCTITIRTFLIQPFGIPSGSMEPTLLVGDRVAVSKFDYGYSHYSIPYSPEIFLGRIFAREPDRGDVVVFRLPKDDTIDYVKRIVGLPGDRIRMDDGQLLINGTPVNRERLSDFVDQTPGGSAAVKRWKETLPNGVSYETLDLIDNGFYDNTPTYAVPSGHYFLMGDNRDNSTDSRVLSQVGYVPFENLIGRVRIVYFSTREESTSIWQTLSASRWQRLMKMVR